ncbi:sugar phosphate nucleotidyltransferase [Actinocorallia sp. A-T 12471]|uniref:sugar phosphate nucleotidyltransferase n=1 Tax=Actinocorallia sp. A-T 12471 TaxID=3089813 RepID=UPI0029CE8D13|nr:sugar phosphate nucleotidyltransferase [Actinocorallia sp. A-T 12471]MDX6741723.1 sugar phosphate nucleotidyltransferase [Actinocorallia sp. A-T 12471]
MTHDQPIQVVIAAGGLGTRVHAWSRYLPKEFYPVNGRPGLLHLLEEIAQSGPAHVVIVYHRYYEAYAAWARHALSAHGRARYQRASGLRLPGADPLRDLLVEFIAQDGPYADLSSVINGADHLARAAQISSMYVAFGDNLYLDANPITALSRTPAEDIAVYARPYQAELAGRRGVLITSASGGVRHMAALIEKPDPAKARTLEQIHGAENLCLLEGRFRLTADFIDFTRRYRTPAGDEPKLSRAISAFARDNLVHVIHTSGETTDLGWPTCTPDPVRQPV